MSVVEAAKAKLTDIFCRCFLERFDIGSNRYCSWKLIDEGGFSFVYQVYDEYNRPFAVKKMIGQDHESNTRIEREIEIHKKLKHRNILELIDFSVQNSGDIFSAYLLLPLQDFSLMDFLLVHFGLKEVQSVPFVIDHNEDITYSLLRQIVYQICAGLEYLHSLERPICHRDLKPGNVLISIKENQIRCKLMDFGSAVKGTVQVRDRKTAIDIQAQAEAESSMAYRALELWDPKVGDKISPACDLWSLGCVIYAIFFGRSMSPFESFLNKDMEPQLEGCSYLKVMSDVAFPSFSSLSIKDLSEVRYSLLIHICKVLLAHSPLQRPSAVDIRNQLFE